MVQLEIFMLGMALCTLRTRRWLEGIWNCVQSYSVHLSLGLSHREQ